MDTKSVWGSKTVQGILVMALIAILNRCGVSLPDAAANDIVTIGLTIAAALWSAYGAADSHASTAKPLKIGGLIIAMAPAVKEIAKSFATAHKSGGVDTSVIVPRPLLPGEMLVSPDSPAQNSAAPAAPTTPEPAPKTVAAPGA